MHVVILNQVTVSVCVCVVLLVTSLTHSGTSHGIKSV